MRQPASPRSELALERRKTSTRHRVIGMPFEPGFEHLDSRLALSLKPQRVGQAFVRDVFLGKLLMIAPEHRERVVPAVATIEPSADTVEKRWVDTLGLGSTQPTIELAERRRDTGFGMGPSKTKLHPNATRRWLLRMDFGIELRERYRVVERPATRHLERYARQNADTKIVSVPAKIALVQLSVASDHALDPAVTVGGCEDIRERPRIYTASMARVACDAHGWLEACLQLRQVLSVRATGHRAAIVASADAATRARHRGHHLQEP